jgi:hypothetical protein
MVVKYRVSRGWRLLVYGGGVVTIPLLIWVGALPFLEKEKHGLFSTLFMLSVSMGMLAMMACGLLETHRGKVIRQVDRIIVVDAFRTRLLLLSQIKGYKMETNYVRLVPVQDGLPTLKINAFVERFDDLLEWLHVHFRDLSLEEQEVDAQRMLAEDEMGTTSEEQEQKWEAARRVAKVLKYTGLGLFFWVIIKPYPYQLVVALCLSVPLLVLLALNWHKGIIHIDEHNNSVHPSAGHALILVPCALTLRAMLDFELLDYRNIWTPVAALTLLLALLLLKSTTELSPFKASRLLIIIVLTLTMFAHCYGGYVLINCLWDCSSPQQYRARVVQKRIDRSQVYSYYLTLTAWGPRQEAEEVLVTHALYEQVQEGNTVHVYLKKGLLDVPWCYVAHP